MRNQPNSNDYIEISKKYKKGKEWDSLLLASDEVLQAQGTNREAALNKTLALEKLGLISEARSFLDEIKLIQEAPWIERERARILVNIGKVKDAERVLLKAEESFPQNPWISEDFVNLLYGQSRLPEIFEYLNSRTTSKTPSDIIIMNLARFNFLENNIEQAKENCNWLIEKDFKPDYLKRFLLNQLDKHKCWDILEPFIESLNIDNESPSVRNLIIKVASNYVIETSENYIRENRSSEGLQFIESKLTKQLYFSEDIVVYYGHLLLAEQNFEASLNIINDFLLNDSSNERVLRLKTKVRLKSKEYDLAYSELKGLQKKKNWLWIKKELAEIYHLRNRNDKAKKLLIEVIQEWPKYVEPHLLLAHICKIEGDIDEGLNILASAWEKNPSLAICSNFLIALCDASRMEEAGFLVDYLSENYSDDKKALFSLIYFYCSMESFEEAIFYLEKREQLYAWDYNNLILRIKYHTSSGTYDEIFTVFERLFEIQSLKPEFMREYIHHCAKRGKKDKVLELIEFAQQNHDEPSLMIRLGATTFSMGLFDIAMSIFNKIKPENIYEQCLLEAHIGLVYSHKFDFESAISYYSNAIELNKRIVWIFERRAFCYMMTNQWKKARNDIDCIVEIKRQMDLKGQLWVTSPGLFGGFYDEFITNQDLLGKIKDINKNNIFDELLNLIDFEPNATLLHFHFLIYGYKKGLFQEINQLPALSEGVEMPKNIFQFWDEEEIPADVLSVMSSWKLKNNSWNYKCYNEKEALVLLSRFSKQVMAAFIKSSSPAMKSDLFRLVLLYIFGGVYADADDACTGSLDFICELDKSLVVYQEFVGTIGNNFLAAKPKNPIVLKILTEVTENILDNPNDSVWFSTGPGCVSRVIGNHIAETLKANSLSSLDIYIMDIEEAYTFTWMHTINSYKNSQKHWQNN